MEQPGSVDFGEGLELELGLPVRSCVTCFVSQIKNNVCKVPGTPWVAVAVQSLNRVGLSVTP